jgi:hypothetical protein
MKRSIGFPLALSVLISLTCTVAALAADRDEAASPARAERPALKVEVPNFALLDYHGKYHELHRTPARAVVLFFTGTGVRLRARAFPNSASSAENLRTRGSWSG